MIIKNYGIYLDAAKEKFPLIHSIQFMRISILISSFNRTPYAMLIIIKKVNWDIVHRFGHACKRSLDQALPGPNSYPWKQLLITALGREQNADKLQKVDVTYR